MALRGKRKGQLSPDKAITIVDLAKKLGVSPTTISRALREKGGMTEDTRERIKKAALLHGYIPNKAGASLSTGRTFSIGYVVPKNERGFPSMLQADVMRGMVEELAHHGYSLTVYSEDYFSTRGVALLEAAREIRADALVVTIEHSDPVPIPSGVLPLPLVIINRRIDGLDADFVLADEERGGQLAVEHLVALGHRRIAYVGGPSDHDALSRRQSGYASALAREGLEFDPALIEHNADFTWRGGFAACDALLDRDPDGFSAIFCGSDLLAFGVLKCLESRGLSVPRDRAVVSFDDVMFADLTEPPLSSVRKPRYAMGMEAARQLVDRLEGRSEAREIRLPVELIVRASSQAGPGGMKAPRE